MCCSKEIKVQEKGRGNGPRRKGGKKVQAKGQTHSEKRKGKREEKGSWQTAITAEM